MEDSSEETIKNSETTPLEQTSGGDEFFEDGNVEFEGEFEEGTDFRFSPGGGFRGRPWGQGGAPPRFSGRGFGWSKGQGAPMRGRGAPFFRGRGGNGRFGGPNFDPNWGPPPGMGNHYVGPFGNPQMELWVETLSLKYLKITNDAGHTVIGKITNNTITDDDDGPTETQNAQCTIKAGNIEASAQASVSKKLEGICGTNQMKISFEILEARLMKEIYQLKAMISVLQPNYAPNYQYNAYSQSSPQQPLFHQSIYPVNLNQHEQAGYGFQSNSPAVSNTFQPINIPQTQHLTSINNPFGIKTTPISVINQPITVPPKMTERAKTTLPNTLLLKSGKGKVIQRPEIRVTTVASTEKILEFKPVQTKSLNRLMKSKNHKPGPRDFEVHKFNNTLLSGGEIRIFTYYWRMENFTAKLKSNASFILSPIFSISGLNLRVKATLNHLSRDYLYLQLESVPNNITDDVSSNIILETGDMFKEIETKKFFRHKIVILDQGTPTSDLISQEFLNTQSGFPVPNSAIKSPPYAKDDSILIKIVIFL